MKEKETTLVLYEPAMCCPSGICGPTPDKTLVQLKSDLEKLSVEYRELKVTRASLSFAAEKFRENETISKLVKENGVAVLPVTLLDGKIVAQQRYLRYEELKAILKAQVNA